MKLETVKTRKPYPVCNEHPRAGYDEELGCLGCWWKKEAERDVENTRIHGARV